jgi:hypothetical protein
MAQLNAITGMVANDAWVVTGDGNGHLYVYSGTAWVDVGQFQGYQGFQGLQGFQGVTGPTGLGYQGLRGFQGFQGVIGFQGAQGFQGFTGPNYNPAFSNISNGSNITAGSYGTYYYITTSTLTAVGIPTDGGTSNIGAFWVFRNATTGYLTLAWTFSNVPVTNTIAIPPSNSLTVMYVNAGGDYGSGAYAVF